MKIKTYTHPNCDHDCTSDCRREGCNCLCGEYHGSMSFSELQDALEDEIRDTKIDTVKMLLQMYVQGTRAYELAAKIVDAVCDKPEMLLISSNEEVELEAKRLTQHDD
jgi:hypothetical protein